jgi:hypothetical protein
MLGLKFDTLYRKEDPHQISEMNLLMIHLN